MDIPKLQLGDIFATRNDNILGRLSRRLFSPYTDRFHFGIVWQKAGGDWIILESIGKGIAVGRLSFYKNQDVKFYRVDCPYGLRRKTGVALTRYGRRKYDYWLIVKVVLGSIVAFSRILLRELRVRRLRAEDLPSIFDWNNELVCTEAVWLAYNVCGVNIIPDGVLPLPSSFRQAELEGRIDRIT